MIKVWNKTDGTIAVTRLNQKAKRPGETDEQLMERTSIDLRLLPEMAGAEELIMEETDLPTRDENRGKWKISANKKRLRLTMQKLFRSLRRKRIEIVRR